MGQGRLEGKKMHFYLMGACNLIYLYFYLESWLKKHGNRDQSRPWMERAGGLNEQHRQGGLSYFPDTTSNAAKESQKDTKETSSSSKGNNDTIRGVAT